MRITAGPYLQNVARDAITIMWHTDEPATSLVEYEQSARLGWSAYEGRPEPTYPCRKEDHALSTVHAVRLTGLEPNRTTSTESLPLSPKTLTKHSQETGIEPDRRRPPPHPRLRHPLPLPGERAGVRGSPRLLAGSMQIALPIEKRSPQPAPAFAPPSVKPRPFRSPPTVTASA